jgi:predicted RNA-binding Zn ribbon-like protein
VEVTGQINFNSHTDAVVAVAVALVNAATPGTRHGRPYLPPTGADLVDAIDIALTPGRGHPTLLDEPQTQALAMATEQLREVFDHVSRGDLDAAADTVNSLLTALRPTPYLDRHDGQPWHLHYYSSGNESARSWAAGCAVGLATVLGSDCATRLGVCSAPRCDRVYVDTSRNGTRRFCCTTCQNRVKSAAHRARTN